MDSPLWSLSCHRPGWIDELNFSVQEIQLFVGQDVNPGLPQLVQGSPGLFVNLMESKFLHMVHAGICFIEEVYK